MTVSQALADQFAPLGVDKRKTAVIENAIDLEHFRPPTPGERLEERAKLGLDAAARAVVFFGRDTFLKGTDVLRGALESKPKIVLLGVGLPAAERESIERLVPVLTFDRVADVRSLYWAADALVVPSRFEASSYALMEALACGLPAVASDIPPLREVAGGIASVRFTPAGNVAELARAIDELSSLTPGEADPVVRERFGLDRWVRDVLALYAASAA